MVSLFERVLKILLRMASTASCVDFYIFFTNKSVKFFSVSEMIQFQKQTVIIYRRSGKMVCAPSVQEPAVHVYTIYFFR